ncbi:MAG: DUF3253 domain-containing protein [Pseudomonadota bacterium]
MVRAKNTSNATVGSDPLTDRAAAAEAIQSLCAARGPQKSICPSEAARVLAGEDGDWRALMDAVRDAAAALIADGRIEATQRGAVVDIATARGPIRLRLGRQQC